METVEIEIPDSPYANVKLSDLAEIEELEWDISTRSNFLELMAKEFEIDVEHLRRNSSTLSLSEELESAVNDKNLIFVVNLMQGSQFISPRYIWNPTSLIPLHFRHRRASGSLDEDPKEMLKKIKVFKLILDKSKVKSKYLYFHTQSYSYRRSLWAERDDSQQKFDISYIKNIKFRIPPIDAQDVVIKNLDNIRKITNQIKKYEENIVMDPISSIQDGEKVAEIAKITGSLSYKDFLDEMIKGGENDHVEFKASFSHCIKEKTKEKRLIAEVIKAIAGFLNKKGGDLLIGVSDKGEVLGIDEELDTHYKSSQDQFKRVFIAAINHSYSSNPDEFINYSFVQSNGKLIFHVECQPSDFGIYTKDKNGKLIFYYRQNPQTIELTGPDLVQYEIKRFHRN
jgi:hypothetical protein